MSETRAVLPGILARHPGSALALGALLVALLAPPLVTYETAWEIAAALGWVAAAAAILCMLVRPGSGVPRRAYRFALHRVAGDALLLLALLHVAVMVAADPFMLDYLGWMMPLHVMTGVVATVLVLLVVLGREPLLPVRPARLAGAGIHAWAGIAATLLVAVHVLWSSTRLTENWRILLVAGALGGPTAVATLVLVSGRRVRPIGPDAGLPPPRAAAVRGLLAVLGGLLLILLGVPMLVALGRG